MKELKQYIYEASISSLLKAGVEKILNFGKKISKKLTKHPYIILNCEIDVWLELSQEKDKHVYIKESAYIREKMKEWFEQTNYTNVTEQKKGQMLIYYYDDLSESEIIDWFEEACLELDKINKELGTDNLDKELMQKIDKEALKVMKNSQLELFNATNVSHKPYKMERGGWQKRNDYSQYYLIRIPIDDNGNPTGDGGSGWFYYPGIYLETE